MARLMSMVSSVDGWKKRTFRWILIVIAVCGFSTQVIKISIRYFEYRTTTLVRLLLRDNLVPHSIQLCIRYGDILERDRLQNETGIKVGRIQDLDEAIAEESSLTLSQIFEFTPDAQEVIDACFFRSANMSFSIRRHRDCNQLFHVSKAFTLEFMCYRFQPLVHTMGEKLTAEAAVQSRYKQYTVFDITLKPCLTEANYIVPIAYVGSYPYESRRFSESTVMFSEAKREANWINVFSNDFIIRQLEKPYDTACIRREYDESFDCRRRCLVSKFRKSFHKLPVSEFLERGSHYKLISTAELNDHNVSRILTGFYAECKKDCHFIPCIMNYTKTTFRTILFKNFSLAFSSMTPTEADIVTEAQPTMSYVEFFSFITGCFGTWFGISFLALDPFRYARNRRALSRTSAAVVPTIIRTGGYVAGQQRSLTRRFMW